MFIHQLISQWDHPLVKPFVSAFASANQKNRLPAGVKGVKRPQRIAMDLGSEFLHIFMSGLLDGIRIRPPKLRAESLQQLDTDSERVLLVFRQGISPFTKLICKFHVPHGIDIAYRLYLSSFI